MKNNKSFLVTGGTGFIGSSICELLIQRGHKVTVFDNNSRGSLKRLLRLNNKIRFIYGDITDYNRMLTATENIDYVIHAAAMKHVPICEYNPFEATKVNVLGTENLIRASIQNNISMRISSKFFYCQ